MKIILKADVPGQGKAGELVDISDGYARNYLFPRKLAVPATPGALKEYEREKKNREAKLAKEKSEAAELSKLLSGKSIVLSAKGGTGGRLFGSLGNTEVTEELNRQYSLKIDKKDVSLSEPIKTTGSYTAKVKLGHGISAEITVVVEVANKG